MLIKMFKNYFKSAFSFWKHNKIFASINAMSLSIALAISFIIMLYVVNEYSYDRCHANHKGFSGFLTIMSIIRNHIQKLHTF